MKTILALSVFALPIFAAPQTWTGQITDSMCGTNHAAMASAGKPMNAHDCTMACTKAGAKFAFVSNGKVFSLANQDFADISQNAGATVNLTGDLGSDGKTITVTTIDRKEIGRER